MKLLIKHLYISFILIGILPNFTFSQVPGPININWEIDNGNVTFILNATFDKGNISNVFDKNANTFARTPSINPLTIWLEFNYSFYFVGSTVLTRYHNATWKVEAAETSTDLWTRSGTYVKLVDDNTALNKVFDTATFSPVLVKYILLTFIRTNGDDNVHLNEWQLFAQMDVDSITVEPIPSDLFVLHPKTTLRLKVTAEDTIFNSTFPVDDYIEWSSSDTSIAKVDSNGVVIGVSVGEVTIFATKDTVQGSIDLHVVTDPNSPDLSICYIKRLPEIDYVENSTNPGIEGWPAVDQEVTWRAYVKNWSPQTLQDIKYKWLYDDVIIDSGKVNFEPYSLSHIDFQQKWDFNRHELILYIDTDKALTEVEENNNNLSIFTNALSVNFYIELSLYEYFRRNQNNLGVNTNCWEDWAQMLHVNRWNQMFASAIFPETPFGIKDRIRIDSIIIVSNGLLPLKGNDAANQPNTDDKTVDLQRGFPSSLLEGSNYNKVSKVSDDNDFYFEGRLLYELGLARYLVECSGFNVSDNGKGGTVAIEEDGLFIGGSYLLPYINKTYVYYTEQKGLMSGDDYTKVDRYSATALNLISGHRASQRNYKTPENSGIFLNDLPEQNIFTVRDNYDNILTEANIKIYQCKKEGWGAYAKFIDNIADIETDTDDKGQFLADMCPFSDDGKIDNLSEGIMLIRVEKDHMVGYTFFESTWFNLAYWNQEIDSGKFEIKVELHEMADIAEFQSNYKPDLIIYPNPTSDYIYIKSREEQVIKFELKLIDLVGKEIQSTSGYLMTNESLKVDVSNLKKGIYMMIIYTFKGDSAYFKVLINE